MPQGASAVSLIVLLAVLTPRDGAAQARSHETPPAAASVAEVRIEPSRAEPRAGEVLQVTVRLLGPKGEPVDGEVAVDCDAGELGPVIRVAEGRYHATLAVPRAIPGTRSLLLAARAGAASSTTILPISAGPPASISLAGPAALRADPASSGWIEVAIRDAFGNPAAGAPHARARLGDVGAPRSTGPGRWEVEYVPAHLLDDAEDVVTVDAEPLRATHRVRLTPRAAWLALAPWSGAVRVEGSNGSALAAGAGAGAWWRVGPGALGLVVDVGWWRLEDTAAVALPGGGAELAGSRTYLPLTASLGGSRRLGARAEAWLALGGGAARVSTSQRLGGEPAITEAGWGPVAAATAALGLRAWRGMPFVEVRGLWIGDPDLVTVTGATRAVLLLAGYRFDAR